MAITVSGMLSIEKQERSPMPIISRSDGELVKNVPAYRRIMPFLLPKRNESNAFFELAVDLTRTLPFIESFNSDRGNKATLFHYMIWCIVRTVDEWPRINRFIAGKRLYQRKGIWISFPAKKSFEENSPVVDIKMQFDPRISFPELVDSLIVGIRRGKSDEMSRVDKELSFFLRLPRSILSIGLKIFYVLDYFGLLPASYIEGEPMYASIFVVNLGGLGMDAVYHHLYEYGNIPIFITIGKVTSEVYRGDDGQAKFRDSVTMRFNCDERVEDGFYCARALNHLKSLIENPIFMGKKNLSVEISRNQGM
jgi:hypothetical protein